MKLSFGALIISNFKSFHGTHTLDFAQLDAGLYYVKGDNKKEPRLGRNGAGKSSLWDAWTWCCWGKTVRELKNQDVRPWTGKGATSVVWLFKIDGKQHTLERTINPNRILLDDREVTQEQITDLLRMEFDLVVNTMLLGQGNDLFLDMQPREKMELLTGAMQLDRWDARSDRAKERAKEYEDAIIELQQEAAGYEAAIDELKTTREATILARDNWEEDQAQRINEAQKAERKAQDHLASTSDKHGAADLKADGAEMEAKHSRAMIEKLDRECDPLEASVDAAELELRAIDQDIEREEEHLASLKVQKNCPTCGHPITRANLVDHREASEKKLADYDAKRVSAHKRLNAHTKVFNAAVGKLKEARKAGASLIEKADKAKYDLEYWHPILAQAKTDAAAASKVALDLEKENNPHSATLHALTKRERDTRRDLAACAADIVKQQASAERNKFWVKGFKDIRLMVIDDVLREFEMICETMLDDIGLVGWAIRIETERETSKGGISYKLNVLIVSPEIDKPVRWESWSGGESQRLRIVGALALSECLLNQVGVTPDVEVLDEPTQWMSREGITDTIALLADRADDINRKVMYVDHQAIESRDFTGTILITKDAKGSRIDVL